MVRGIVIKPGDIFRDLGAMSDAFDLRGGGGSPKELRSDAGVMTTYDTSEILKRHVELMFADVTNNQIAATPANTSNSTTFSFGEDHYLLGVAFESGVNPANFAYGVLSAEPTPGAGSIIVCHALLADRVTFTGLAGDNDDWFFPQRTFVPIPFFMPAEADYTFHLRSGAGGAVTSACRIYRVEAPKGVPIAH